MLRQVKVERERRKRVEEETESRDIRKNRWYTGKSRKTGQVWRSRSWFAHRLRNRPATDGSSLGVIRKMVYEDKRRREDSMFREARQRQESEGREREKVVVVWRREVAGAEKCAGGRGAARQCKVPRRLGTVRLPERRDRGKVQPHLPSHLIEKETGVPVPMPVPSPSSITATVPVPVPCPALSFPVCPSHPVLSLSFLPAFVSIIYT